MAINFVTAKQSSSPRQTREQICAARITPMVPLLEKRGLQMIERPADNVELPAYKDLIVKDSYGRWPEQNKCGNSIHFFVQILGLSFLGAMHQIFGS